MYNKIIIAGNLTRDIEIRYSQGGSAIGNTGIATTRKFKKQDGTQGEEVLFVDLTFFGRSAEIANQYLRKGSKILVDGRLKLDQWEDSQTGQKRSKHSVTVENLQMLDSKPQTEQQPQQSQYQQPQQSPQQNYNQPQAPSSKPASQQNQQGSFPIVIEEESIPFDKLNWRL